MADASLRLVVFDFDGTLVDSGDLIVAAMRTAFGCLGVPCPPAASVRRVIGPSLRDVVAALAPPGARPDLDALTTAYRQAYAELTAGPGVPETLYPGAVGALDELEAAGYVLGIATGKSRRGLGNALARHGLEGRFVTVQTADGGPGKPHPGMLQRAIDEVGGSAVATCMIGDTVFDVEMARAAGVAALGVGWGYHEKEELLRAGAAEVVAAFGGLPGAVDRVFRRG